MLVIKVHLPVEQLLLILIVLLLPFINNIESQVELGEVVVHELIEVCSIKTCKAHLSAAPGHMWGIFLLLNGDSSRTTRNIRTSLKAGTITTYIATFTTNIPTMS